jgi:hypothetical protein
VNQAGNRKDMQIGKFVFCMSFTPYFNVSCSGLYCPGVMPACFLNTRIKFCWELKPEVEAIFFTGLLVVI